MLSHFYNYTYFCSPVYGGHLLQTIGQKNCGMKDMFNTRLCIKMVLKIQFWKLVYVTVVGYQCS